MQPSFHVWPCVYTWPLYAQPVPVGTEPVPVSASDRVKDQVNSGRCSHPPTVWPCAYTWPLYAQPVLVGTEPNPSLQVVRVNDQNQINTGRCGHPSTSGPVCTHLALLRTASICQHGTKPVSTSDESQGPGKLWKVQPSFHVWPWLYTWPLYAQPVPVGTEPNPSLQVIRVNDQTKHWKVQPSFHVWLCAYTWPLYAQPVSVSTEPNPSVQVMRVKDQVNSGRCSHPSTSGPGCVHLALVRAACTCQHGNGTKPVSTSDRVKDQVNSGRCSHPSTSGPGCVHLALVRAVCTCQHGTQPVSVSTSDRVKDQVKLHWKVQLSFHVLPCAYTWPLYAQSVPVSTETEPNPSTQVIESRTR